MKVILYPWFLGDFRVFSSIFLIVIAFKSYLKWVFLGGKKVFMVQLISCVIAMTQSFSNLLSSQFTWLNFTIGFGVIHTAGITSRASYWMYCFPMFSLVFNFIFMFSRKTTPVYTRFITVGDVICSPCATTLLFFFCFCCVGLIINCNFSAIVCWFQFQLIFLARLFPATGCFAEFNLATFCGSTRVIAQILFCFRLFFYTFFLGWWVSL
jgi:hypothetical protein